ncbi:DUF1796 family putative cysteine peptidase [Paenibacillus sp. 1-18]|uniref:DUF1796 family putative cysteine peptidase n=1 Tax=Paenibacillus sp. 1-18 TaxID=1333846 RepID=UPI0009E09AA3
MGDYDAVFSLGGHCLPSIQLDKNGMRPYAGPLDWMISGNQHLTSYPAFKTMLDRRITWLLEKFALASRLLLVRVGGSREQVIELDWGPERVVSMALPPEDIWNGQDELGCYMLENIRLQV